MAKKLYRHWARLPEWALHILEYGYSDTESDSDVELVKDWIEESGYQHTIWEAHPDFWSHNDISRLGGQCVDLQYASVKEGAPLTAAKPWGPTRFITRRYPDGGIVALFNEAPYERQEPYWQVYDLQNPHYELRYAGDDGWRKLFRSTKGANQEETEAMREQLQMAGCFNPQPRKRS